MACLVLLSLTLLAYSNSFHAGFVLDSRTIILENPLLRQPWHVVARQISRLEYWWPLAGEGLYRPFTIFSYWCNYHLLGNADRPLGYHVVNLLLHGANVLLLYSLVLVVTVRRKAAAFLAGAIFALHPIATEAVTNLVGRADLFAALGVIGGLLAYIRSQSAPGKQRILWLAALMVAGAVGLFSKENAIVLPGVLVLYDLVFRLQALHRTWIVNIARNVWLRLRSGYWVLLPPLVAWVAARHAVLARTPVLPVIQGDNILVDGNAWIARLTALKIIGRYLWLLVWPRTLSADYSYDQIPLVHWPLQTWEDGKLLVALATVAVAVWIAVRTWRRQPAVSFFILFFFVTLAPVSNLIVFCGSTMAERFVYLPLVGFAGLAGILGAAFVKRVGKPAVIGCALVLLAYGIRTYVRNEDWQDDLRFWTRLTETSPHSSKAHAGLAGALMEHDPQHEYIDAAVVSVQRALAIAPDDLLALTGAGSVYRIKGDTVAARDAQGQMQQTAASAGWYRKSLSVLRRAAALSARLQQGRRDWEASQARVPQRALNVLESGIFDEMGQTLLRLGDAEAAIEAFLQARQANPTRDTVYQHLGFAYASGGRLPEAARSYWQALSITTDRTTVLGALNGIYAQLAGQDCWIPARDGTHRLNVSCPMIHEHICQAYAEVAQLLDNAGQQEFAQQARERATTENGCAP